MKKARKIIGYIGKIGWWMLCISLPLILIECVLLLTIDYFGIFSTITIVMMLLGSALAFISFIILEALPKEEVTKESDEITNRVTEAKEQARKIALERLMATTTNTKAYIETQEIKKKRLQDSLSRVKHPAKHRAKFINDYLKGYNYSLTWPVTKIFLLESKKDGNRDVRSYLLVLGRRYKHIDGKGHEICSLEERLLSFNNFFRENLLDGEKLYHHEEAFCINSKDYDINYYIEAYRRNPDLKCYMDIDEPKVEPLYGESAAGAFYELKHTFGTHSDVIEKVFIDMNNDEDYAFIYPNARDRFVALCNKYKKLYSDGKVSKVNEFGQKIYPLSQEEEKIYNRLMEQYPQEADMIEHELTSKPDQRDWQELEEMIREMF